MPFQIQAPPSGTQASRFVLHTSIFHSGQWDVRAGCSLQVASICYASFPVTDSIYRTADKREIYLLAVGYMIFSTRISRGFLLLAADLTLLISLQF